MDYAVQTVYSSPGSYGSLFDALPDDVAQIAVVVRNLLIHYRGGGITFTGERLAEIDNRWVSTILGVDQKRNGTALAVPREPADRVVGCCRDYTLLFVSALRHKGIPARSRVGFAVYFGEGFNYDHVVAEYWNGDRWVMIDAQLDPIDDPRPFDVSDMPEGPFRSAAEVWLGIRAGELDASTYGVDPGLPHLTGEWLVRNYVHLQLAHLNGDELLLWDNWGSMTGPGPVTEPDALLADEVARLLVASDAGDTTATKEVNDLYQTNPALTFTGQTFVTSPSGTPPALVTLQNPE
ncbi:transglutaminase-like domain-containing protein [Kribbella sp. NPDC026611]|uniref:transglutaminase-like domain-containing protein n=1 Tax=Kribbella sp. NPDC026611 TaxID=3154911 RepID=UPI0033F610A3